MGGERGTGSACRECEFAGMAKSRVLDQVKEVIHEHEGYLLVYVAERCMHSMLRSTVHETKGEGLELMVNTVARG